MEFGFDSGPHIKDKDNTSKIMSRLSIALFPIIIFSIYKNGISPYLNGYGNFYYAIRPILMFIIAILTSLITEYLYFKFILNRKDKSIKFVKESYALLPPIFLVLTIPINTPLWLVMLGSFVATFIGKLLFGGFGFNIFNPALVGNLFVMTSYSALIGSRGGYLNAFEVDTIASATPLTNLNALSYTGDFSKIVTPFGSLLDFLTGFIPGSMGETCKILIILAFIFLVATKVIKWIIPTIYVLTVFLMTLIIGGINDIGIWYSLFHILSGGLLFGAVFMATDPVTSPVTKVGQVLFALGLGLLTVLFRFLTPYPEGVLTSILTMNMLAIILDRIGAKAKFKKLYIYIPIAVMSMLILFFSIYIGFNIKKDEKVADSRFKIINIEKNGNTVIYEVNQKGFKSTIEAFVTLKSGTITDIEVTAQHETYWQEIKDQGYLNSLIRNQKDLDNVDVVSGATISSNSFKNMVINILKDYESRYK
jgi:electron transport complex protein RnfD